MKKSVVESVPEASKTWRIGRLVLYLAVSATMLMVGGWLTALGMGPWYENLKLPPWQPPGWVFAPVWMFLLTLLAISTWRVSVDGARIANTRVAMILYWMQVLLNVGWSLLFFALHLPAIALIEIILLDAVVIAMVATYSRISLLASVLIVPYAVWLGFATAINLWIVVNN